MSVFAPYKNAFTRCTLPYVFLLTVLLLRALPPLGLKRCGRVVLISAARHGSTWFIDCAEGCTSANGTYGNLNSETELWNAGQPGLHEIAPLAAAMYARLNRSVKIFPTALETRPTAVATFLGHAKELSLPVFLLTRKLEDSYGSLEEVRARGVWNSAKGMQGRRRRIVKDSKFEKYARRIGGFFDGVREIMKKTGVVWDEVEYEVVSRRDVIVGHRNRCFINNCNFAM